MQSLANLYCEKGIDAVLGSVLISETDLQARIKALGADISRDYAGKDLLLVSILKGGVVFMTDLMRALTVPHHIDFMAVSSYGVGARVSRGQPRIVLDLNTDIRNRHVLLVEDIIDSGHSIDAVLRLLAARLPASLKVCTLLDKPSRREAYVPISYLGFEIPNEFVFGYGLDIDEYCRHVPFIGTVKKELLTR
jgi:hypoxanthine phosphoribosyltransferase